MLFLTPLQAAAEEYAFRGYLTQAFGGLVASPVVAVGASSFLFALAHGAQDAPIFFDRFAFGVVAGTLVIAHRAASRPGIAMHVLNNWLAFGIALVVRRHGFGPQPDRRHLVEHPGDAHPVAHLPAAGVVGGPRGWASRPGRTRPFWPLPRRACKVSPRLGRGTGGRDGRAPTLLPVVEEAPSGHSDCGIWCNWQHDWFWSS